VLLGVDMKDDIKKIKKLHENINKYENKVYDAASKMAEMIGNMLNCEITFNIFDSDGIGFRIEDGCDLPTYTPFHIIIKILEKNGTLTLDDIKKKYSL